MSSYLGQNFLQDGQTIQEISDKIHALVTKYSIQAVIEIGPGKGAITRKLSDISNFFVIEKDETMEASLTKIPNFDIAKQVFWGDVLDFDVDGFCKQLDISKNQILICGNLPYYITSPIISKFFGYGKTDFGAGVFMVQKEVADKLDSDTTKKSFLRWLLNMSYDVQNFKFVPKKYFKPAPKVDSAVISIVPKLQHYNINFDSMFMFLDMISGYKRKTFGKIKKIIEKKYGSDDICVILDHPHFAEISHLRLESLSLDDIQEILG